MEKVPKSKKVFVIIRNVFLTILILLVLFIVGIFVFDKICDAQEWDKLKEAGYVNTVSVGSHNLNVCIKGNTNASCTVVSVAGLKSMANVIDMENVTDKLRDKFKDKYCFAFVDRSGYGLSDDTHEEQTVEQVVSDYRTALKNSGVKAPYILAAHSFGGVYSSFWQQKYPDEIKAVIYFDPTQIGNLNNSDEEMKNRHANFGMNMNVIFSKLGADRPFFNSSEYTVDLKTPKQKEYADMMWHRCPMTWAACSEENNYYENVRKTTEALVPNKIPKLYIDAQAYTLEDVREKVAYSKMIAQQSGSDMSELLILEESIDEHFVDGMKMFFEYDIKPYIDKLGNVTYVNIPGHHYIFKHKPDEVAKVTGDFLEKIK